MSRVFKTLRRMVSWSRDEETAPQLPKEAQDAPEQPALPPPPPPAPKAAKRKYAASDDEGTADTLAKRPKADNAAPQPGETSAAPALSDVEPKPVPEAEPEPAPSEPSDSQSVAGDDDKQNAAATAATQDAAEDEPKAAPDTPEPESKAEDDAGIPELDENGPNVFLTWADGLIGLLDGVDTDEPVLFLKSQILEAYKEYLAEDAGRPEEMDYSVGYWGIEIAEDAQETDLAHKFVSNWANIRQDPANKGAWWWEVTVVRDEPKDETPRLKVQLESSRHNEDHEIAGGKQLGEWWLVGLQRASPDADKLMQMHRDLY